MNIVIVGSGFGGVKAALELAKNKKNHITILTDKEDFQYFPALYSTATGRSHKQAWIPLGQIFTSRSNIDVIIDPIVRIDSKAKLLTGESGNTYGYTKVILALGSVTTYFGVQGLDAYSHGIKSSDEIKQLKRHLYKSMFEDRVIEKDYVVIGAGPTGIELASSMGEYIERLRVDYRLPKRKTRINIVEASPRVMPRMSEYSSRKIAKRLKQLGVHVMTNKKVEEQTADELLVSGRPIKSGTVIWTSGVATSPFYQANESEFIFSPNRKVVVDDYMRAGKDIYVIGDNAFTPYSGLAQTAMYDAKFVARDIERRKKGKKATKYKPMLPPVVLPVGRRWAAFEWRWIRFYGWPASLVRSVADFIGYMDILPLGRAIDAWRSQDIYEDDYFAPTPATEAE